MTSGKSHRLSGEYVLAALAAGVFCLSSLYTVAVIVEGAARDDYLPLFSVLLMALSGFALIGLLAHKLRVLGRALREGRKMAGLLEPRMAAIAETRDGIGITNGRGEIGYVNPSLAQYHGYDTPSDMIGLPWSALFGGEQYGWMEKEMFPVLKEQGYWRGHCTGRKKNGGEFPMDLTVTLLDDRGWVWVLRDYSELMQTVALSNRRLAAIEAAGDGIGIVDSRGHLVYLNRSLMKLHGIDPAESESYMGRPWESLYNEKGYQEIHTHVMPVLKAAGYWQGESPILRKDGKITHAEMSLTMLPDGGFIGTARDISDRKKIEKEKEDLQRQFFQAQKMEAVGRLAGGIAHDFNNILASMLGYTGFLMEDLPAASKEQEFAKKIMQGGIQAKHLVEQILAFSRRNESARGPLNLVESVSETAMMLRSTLSPTMALDVSMGVNEAWISANGVQIGQILMNLCVNARDAMGDDAHGRLKIGVDCIATDDTPWKSMLVDDVPEINYAPEQRLEEDTEGGTILQLGGLARGRFYIQVSIDDTGCGMPREVMERAFEPFFTTKAVDRGTGLGLSTVHGMMASHQGAVVVRSRVGQGTSFFLYFPAAESAESRDLSGEERPGAAGQGGGRRILVVEDQEHVRDMLVQMLGRMGYQAESCLSGDGAIDHLRENPGLYDLVLSDHLMPGMTGVEMAEHIRGDFPDMPVILISGYARKSLESVMEKNSAVRAVLKKPVDSNTLGSAISAVLQGRRKVA